MSTVSVRYIVNDVDAAIVFYTEHLGFSLTAHPAKCCAKLSCQIIASPSPASPGRLSVGAG